LGQASLSIGVALTLLVGKRQRANSWG
jgi:hypothetical protein